MTTATKPTCKTNYVYLEMVLNKGVNYDVIVGLLKGVIEKNGQTFILLTGLNNATNVLNTKFFNFMTIEEREGDYKNLTYLTAERVDQETAMEIVQKMYTDMIEGGMGLVNDGKIIDIEKYTEVPDDYKTGKPVGGTAATPGAVSGVGNFASPGTRFQNTGSLYNRQATIKTEPSPSLIKRTKSKRPSKVVLETMLEKVQQIRTGDYEPDLPATMGTDDAGVTEAEEDAGYSYYGIGCG